MKRERLAMRYVSRKSSVFSWLFVLLYAGLLASVDPAVAQPAAPCAQGKEGGRLCLQNLQPASDDMSAFFTYLNPARGPELVDAPVLEIDGMRQPAGPTIPFERSQGAIDLIAVIQRDGVKADCLTSLKSGLSTIADTIYRISGSKMGIMGYGTEKATYEPNVVFGDEPTVRAAIRGLATPPHSSTNYELHDALDSAVERMSRLGNSPRRRVILLFSNSQEREKNQKALFLKLKERALHADVTVSLVLYPGLNRPREFLDDFIAATGGNVYQSLNPGQLPRAFQFAAVELGRQTVYRFHPAYNVQAQGPQEHQIVLKANGLAVVTSKFFAWPQAKIPVVDFSDPPKPPVSKIPRAYTVLALGLGSLILLLVGGGLTYVRWRGVPSLFLVRRAQRNGAKANVPQPLPRLNSEGHTFKNGDLSVRLQTQSSINVTPVRSLTSVCFLYDLEQRQTHVIPSFPYRIGNDLDCDLVLYGVGGEVCSCVLNMDQEVVILQPTSRNRDVVLRNRQIDRSMAISDRTEFAIAGNRLVFFQTAMG